MWIDYTAWNNKCFTFSRFVCAIIFKIRTNNVASVAGRATEIKLCPPPFSLRSESAIAVDIFMLLIYCKVKIEKSSWHSPVREAGWGELMGGEGGR